MLHGLVILGMFSYMLSAVICIISPGELRRKSAVRKKHRNERKGGEGQGEENMTKRAEFRRGDRRVSTAMLEAL